MQKPLVESTPPASSGSASPAGKYRWRICALLFLATTINYMDRSVLGVLAPTLQYKVFNWTDNQYAWINIWFKVAYAIGMLSMGAVIDRFGTKIGYTLAIGIWSIFGMLHAAVRPAFSFVGFCVARFGLGIGESGNFPAAIKTVGEWFPKKERAFATGIFNAGSNIGAILAPSIIPLVVWPDGTHWQYAFLTTGIFSALWVMLWLKTYRRPETHPKLSQSELAYINSDSVPESAEKLSWFRVLPHRETWAFAAAKITDAVWWFYLFWGGKFLYDKFGLDIKSLALPLIVIFLLADGGSVAGGWLSSFFIKRGWPVNRARKTTLFICACCILPVMLVTQISTHFNVDARFFNHLQTATYATERLVTVNGKTAPKRTREPVSAEAQSQLQALSGRSFDSAKDFIGATAATFVSAKTPAVQALIPETGATLVVNEALMSRVRETMSEQDAEALRRLRGNEFQSRQAMVEAVAGTLGRAEANRMDQALLSSARTNNYVYWIAVLLIALGAGGHQAWSANIFTLVSDVFPKKAIASVTGIGGMVGAAAGFVADFSLGKVLTSSGPAGYFFAFLIAGSCYLILLGVAHLLMPKMTPLDENLNHVRPAA